MKIRPGEMAQLAKYLPWKHEDLSSNPVPCKAWKHVFVSTLLGSWR